MGRSPSNPLAVLLALLPALFLLSPPADAQSSPIRHRPPPALRPGETAVLLFTWEGSAEAVSAEFRIRPAGDTLFARLPVEERRGAWRVEVPARFAEPPGYEYVLLVRAADGTEAFSPDRYPAAPPHRARVEAPESGDGGAERVVILAPEPGGRVGEGEEFLLSVLFDPPLGPGEDAALRLDGAAVDSGTERTSDYLLYAPEDSPPAGGHEAVVTIAGAEGGAEKSWRFTVGGAPAAGGEGTLLLTGRAEAGWAGVSASRIEGDPYLAYDETSTLAWDLYAYGSRHGWTFSFSSSRDPIYDGEVRLSAGLSGERLAVEAGDIYPALSELSVSWLSGEGGLLSWEGDRFRASAFLLRAVEADTSGGLGVFAQYVGGGRAGVAAGRWEAGVNALYGWERESSVPEEVRFLDPVRNGAVTADGRYRFNDRIRLDLEAGWSETEGDEGTGAAAWRAVLAYADRAERTLSVEARDIRPGYATLGNPTVDGGEYGVLLDGSARVRGGLRQSLRVELMRDRETSQPIRAGGVLREIYARTDLDWRRFGVDWNPYLLFRSYHIPYEENAYRSRYGSAGLYLRRNAHTLSLNLSRSLSRSSAETDGWNGSASWSGAAGPLSWRFGYRRGASETTGDSTGTALEGTYADERSRSFTSEATLRAAGLEWRAEYERIDQEDRAEKERSTEHLAAFLIGRRF